MNIKSKIPVSWPALGVSLKEGSNEIDEARLPMAAHEKLALLAKKKVIEGYAPSAEFVRAAEQFATGKVTKAPAPAPAVAPSVVTSAASEPAAPADMAYKRR